MATVGEVAAVLDRLWPPEWAAAWDNAGLLIGDPAAPVARCACALDADDWSVGLAVAGGAGLLLCHHPLPFRPLRQILGSEPAGATVLALARQGLALYAAHTNFDVHPEGTSQALVAALGLEHARLLRQEAVQALYRIVAFVPEGHEDAVRRALAAAGAGRLGHYSDCSFATRGSGRFRPLAGADPFIGEVGAVTVQPEVRIEVIVSEAVRAQALAALVAAHPYEAPAYDVLRLENPGAARGLGAVGDLKRPVPLRRFAHAVATRLAAPATRFVGDPDVTVGRVAVCGGAGGELAGAALAAGAQVLVTADVRYHEAREIEARGLALVDPGHQATEQPAILAMAGAARAALSAVGLDVAVDVLPPREDVWRALGTRAARKG